MTQFFGYGAPVNPDLVQMIDYRTEFENYGLSDLYEAKAASLTHADVSGTERISQWASLKESGPTALAQATDLRKPEYAAGAGPNGLTDAVRFARARGDRLNYGTAAPIGTHTNVAIVKPGVLGGAPYAWQGKVWGSNNSANGRMFLDVRQNSASAFLAYAYLGQSGADASISAAITVSTWMMLIQTWDAATLVEAVGVLPQGGASISWTTNVGEAGTEVTQTSRGMGAANNFADALEGDVAGFAIFDGFDAYTDVDMLAAILAWAKGNDSVFGL